MKIKVNIPQSLDDVTLRDYKHFLKIQENNEDGRFVKAKMLEIFCKIGLKEVYRMKYKDSEEVLSILEKTFNDKPSLVRKFKLGKTQYGFHPQLDDLTFGEYIDLDTYIGDWDNIEKAMNVLYRPIITSIGEKYAIDEYNTENDKYLLDMPMSAVTSSIFFLMKLGADLSNHILKSLEKDNEEIYQQFLTLEKNGDGISQFGLYVDQTLQKLNISLN
ncbi:MAG: hypothetical protein Tp1138SUR256061_26 [Prokaryotic dsDNA virus sp.]|jgi:hypothetical protein|nr:MAG: hypothetical protein Tp1138SUR256061_26 [Prokaryotic dsDNA virus sp.]|tara:strand:- start:561 stop:1211 length:651 start_codon:yes stop_codon:yes gene_type:complete